MKTNAATTTTSDPGAYPSVKNKCIKYTYLLPAIMLNIQRVTRNYTLTRIFFIY